MKNKEVMTPSPCNTVKGMRKMCENTQKEESNKISMKQIVNIKLEAKK